MSLPCDLGTHPLTQRHSACFSSCVCVFGYLVHPPNLQLGCHDISTGAVVDRDGDGCDVYDRNPSLCGGRFDPPVGFAADTVCCACGGGSTGAVTIDDTADDFDNGDDAPNPPYRTLSRATFPLSDVENGLITTSFALDAGLAPTSSGADYQIVVSASNTAAQLYTAADHRVMVRSPPSTRKLVTDKPIYKPGQRMRGRVLALDSDLLPDQCDAEVTAVDPSGNKMARWNLASTAGFVSFEMLISDEPVLGEWKLQAVCLDAAGEPVGEAAEELVFEIAEYVLPKFEVEVDVPLFVSHAQAQAGGLSGTVAGTYTYGETVPGTATLSVSLVRSAGVRVVLQTLEVTLNENGSATGFAFPAMSAANIRTMLNYPYYEFPSTQSAISSRYGEASLELSATIVEVGTGLNMSEATRIETRWYEVDYAYSAEHEPVPGLPFEVIVQALNMDGSPMIVPPMIWNDADAGLDDAADSPFVPTVSLTRAQSHFVQTPSCVPTGRPGQCRVTVSNISADARSLRFTSSPLGSGSRYVTDSVSPASIAGCFLALDNDPGSSDDPELVSGIARSICTRSIDRISIQVVGSGQLLSSGTVAVDHTAACTDGAPLEANTECRAQNGKDNCGAPCIWATSTETRGFFCYAPGDVVNCSMFAEADCGALPIPGCVWGDAAPTAAPTTAPTAPGDFVGCAGVVTVTPGCPTGSTCSAAQCHEVWYGNDCNLFSGCQWHGYQCYGPGETVLCWDHNESTDCSCDSRCTWYSNEQDPWNVGYCSEPGDQFGTDDLANEITGTCESQTPAVLGPTAPGSPIEARPRQLCEVPFEIRVPGGLSHGSSLTASYVINATGDDAATYRAEVISDSISLERRSPLPNTVDMTLQTAREGPARPGDPVSLSVSTTGAETGGRSMIALAAVDRSVSLLRARAGLSGGAILNDRATSHSMTESTPSSASQTEERCGHFDAIFQNRAGLVLLTNIPLHEGASQCWRPRTQYSSDLNDDDLDDYRDGWDDPEDDDPGGSDDGAMAGDDAADGGQDNANGGTSAASPATRTRSRFPETWIWAESTIDDGPTGAQLNFTVPDTITSWTFEAFAVSSANGLGIASPLEMTTFKDLFLAMVLPYSVTRGEAFELKIAVYNYGDVTVEVDVSLDANPTEYEIVGEGSTTTGAATTMSPVSSKRISAAPGRPTIASFAIRPTTVGTARITARGTIAGGGLGSDAVRRSLLVKPEGVRREYVSSTFVSMDEGGSTATSVLESLVPTDALVPGSSSVRIAVTADLMSSSIAGLDRLVRMPHGCGEQNMITFAPLVSATQYMEATGALAAEIAANANDYIVAGYQRELTYRHTNGGFSAFGNSDSSASTWLTAFVVKSLALAKSRVYVDPQVLTSTVDYLLTLQVPGDVQQQGSCRDNTSEVVLCYNIDETSVCNAIEACEWFGGTQGDNDDDPMPASCGRHGCWSQGSQVDCEGYRDDCCSWAAATWIASGRCSVSSEGGDPHPPGSISTVGRVIHHDMMGGVQGPLAMTAYVAAAIVEAHDSLNGAPGWADALQLSVEYLESQVPTLTGAHRTALVCYALTKCARSDVFAQGSFEVDSDPACAKMMELAVDDGGDLKWEDANSPVRRVATRRWQREFAVSSTVVESTAYALMASMDRGDLLTANRAAKWLARNRNSAGGWRSTQDTVLALEALAKFAAVADGHTGEVTLDFSATDGSQIGSTMSVTAANADVLQMIDVDSPTPTVTVQSQGIGAVLVSALVSWHESAAFAQAAPMVAPSASPTATTARTTPEPDEPDIAISATCVEATGDDLKLDCTVCAQTTASFPLEATGMAVIEAGLFSGMSTTASGPELKEVNPDSVKRIDLEGGKVAFYLDRLSREETCVVFTTIRRNLVAELRPVVIEAYDYYDTWVRAAVELPPIEAAVVSLAELLAAAEGGASTDPPRTTAASSGCARNCGTVDRGGGTCRSNGRCRSCNEDRVLQGGRCFTSIACKGRRIQSGSATGDDCRCLDDHCHYCNRVAAGDSCRVCRDGYYLLDAACVAECPAGMASMGIGQFKRRCMTPFDCARGRIQGMEVAYGCKCATDGRTAADCQLCQFRADEFGQQCTRCLGGKYLHQNRCRDNCDGLDGLVEYNAGNYGRECREPFTCTDRTDSDGAACKCARMVGGSGCSVCEYRRDGSRFAERFGGVDGPGTDARCLRCTNGLHLAFGQCVEECPPGTSHASPSAPADGRECE